MLAGGVAAAPVTDLGGAVQYVLTYRSVEDFYDLAMANYPAHLARLLDFQRRGLLLMAGPFVDPMDGDSMAIFTTREAVDEFVSEDPFVLNGVVASHTVRAWDGTLEPGPAADG